MKLGATTKKFATNNINAMPKNQKLGGLGDFINSYMDRRIKTWIDYDTTKQAGINEYVLWKNQLTGKDLENFKEFMLGAKVLGMADGAKKTLGAAGVAGLIYGTKKLYDRFTQPKDENKQKLAALSLKNKLLATTAAAPVLYSAYKGMRPADEQAMRAIDYMTNAMENPITPLPSMTVTASYVDTANKFLKTATNQNSRGLRAIPDAAIASLSNVVAQKFVSDPIDYAHMKIKRKLVDEPEWRRNFKKVIASDPELQEAHARDPNMLPRLFESIKRYSPTLAKDHLGTKNILRHGVHTGGVLDVNTLKLLAETEKLRAETLRR
jgi:hypothetical protein